MKSYWLPAIISLISVMTKAQDTSDISYHFTFEECISYALDKNYNRQSLKLTEESKAISFRQAKDERLPDLNASISENFTNTKDASAWNGSYGLNSSVTVYQGGSINQTIEQNKLQMEQSSYQTTQYENELTIQVLQSFLSVLGNEELLKYQYSVAEASREQLNQGKEQFRVGKILESDYLMLEAQYANDQNNIVDTEISRTNNLLKLKSLLSMDPSVDLQVVHPDTTMISGISVLPTQGYVMEKSLNYMPELKISQYQVDIANTAVKISQAGYYPTISLGASIGTGHSDYSGFGSQLSDRLNEQVGVTVSIPIFNKNRTKSKVSQSKISLQQAQLDQMQTELDLKQNIAQEYQNVLSAYNKYNVTDVRQNAYLRTFEAYTAQFNAGAITAVDLLQQQNNYISSLNDYIQSKYSFILLRKVLDVYMGEQVVM